MSLATILILLLYLLHTIYTQILHWLRGNWTPKLTCLSVRSTYWPSPNRRWWRTFSPFTPMYVVVSMKKGMYCIVHILHICNMPILIYTYYNCSQLLFFVESKASGVMYSEDFTSRCLFEATPLINASTTDQLEVKVYLWVDWIKTPSFMVRGTSHLFLSEDHRWSNHININRD